MNHVVFANDMVFLLSETQTIKSDVTLFPSLITRPLFEHSGITNIVIQMVSTNPLGIDMTVEGMQSHRFSVGIFIFLIIGIAVFSGIAVAFMPRGKSSRLKRGEKILFAWIFFGVMVSIIIGAAQLLYGNLF